MYDGGFMKGSFYGTGSLWDEKGNLIYKGDFVNGIYHGEGVLYEASTGRILAEGQFKNSVPVPAEEVSNSTEQTVLEPAAGEIPSSGEEAVTGPVEYYIAPAEDAEIPETQTE